MFPAPMIAIFIFLKDKCHSDDRREEESREHKVSVTEILRHSVPLNDNIIDN